MATITIDDKEYEVLSNNVNPFTVYRGRITGINPQVDYDHDLLIKMQDAWHRKLSQVEYKHMQVESQTRSGIVYDVKSINGEYFCSCPARVECWHIKMARKIWEGEA